MQDLRLALFQMDLAWEQAEANQSKIESLFSELKSPVDLVILPEMFTTGFTMESSKVSESKPYRALQWMQDFALKNKVAVTGSFVAEEDGQYFNRLYFVKPDGTSAKYDKRHLFRMANEHQHFKAGNESLIVEYKGWKIKPLVCYDLRFPVWSRNQNDYDLLIYVANWPKARVSAWDALLKARAIENYAYCVGVNRTGLDGNGIEYNGASIVYDPKGERLTEKENGDERVLYCNVSREDLDSYRKKFPVHLDADDFSLNL